MRSASGHLTNRPPFGIRHRLAALNRPKGALLLLTPASGFRARHHDEEPGPVPTTIPNGAPVGLRQRHAAPDWQWGWAMAEVLPLDPPRKHSSSNRRGSETRKRSVVITFRADIAEWALLKASADRAGLSIGSYIRSRALANPTTRATRRPSIERAALAQLLSQLGRVGGNLAQITRALNFGRMRQAAFEPRRANSGSDLFRPIASRGGSIGKTGSTSRIAKVSYGHDAL